GSSLFRMRNIKKTGWCGHLHPSFKSFSTMCPALLMILIIPSISIVLTGEMQLGIFGLAFINSGS
ncbi:MAG: hypothetical protein NTW84_05050, partial [Methanothrix sp.]|nr:hypothetical protein [Methanothrix sp.]